MSLCPVLDDYHKYFKLQRTANENIFHGTTTSYATKHLNQNIPREVTITRLGEISGSLSRKLFMLRALDHVRLPKVYGCIIYDHTTHVISDSWESMLGQPGGPITLERALDSKLSVRERRMIVKQLIGGLEYLHGLEIVHRNLRPDNILVLGRGAGIAIQIVGLDYMCEMDWCDDMGGPVNNYSLPNLQRVLLKRPSLEWQRLVLQLADLWAFGRIVIDLLEGYSDLHIYEQYGLFELDTIINGDEEWHHRVTAENIRARIGREPAYRSETEWSFAEPAVIADVAAAPPERTGSIADWQLIDPEDPFIEQQWENDWQIVQNAGGRRRKTHKVKRK